MYSNAFLQKKVHRDTSQSPDHMSNQGKMSKSLAPLEKQEPNWRFPARSARRGWTIKMCQAFSGLGRRDKSCPKHSPIYKEHMIPTPMWDPSEWTMVWGKSAAPTRWQHRVTLNKIEVNRSLVRASEFSLQRNHELGQLDTGLALKSRDRQRRAERTQSGKQKREVEVSPRSCRGLVSKWQDKWARGNNPEANCPASSWGQEARGSTRSRARKRPGSYVQEGDGGTIKVTA